MAAMKTLGRSLARVFLGGLIGITSLGFSGSAAAAAPERETVTLTIRCTESSYPAWSARRSRRHITTGYDWGRGWSYDWYCVTLRNGDGKEEHHVWIDFEQWGGSSVNLKVVSPVDAQLRWIGAPSGAATSRRP